MNLLFNDDIYCNILSYHNIFDLESIVDENADLVQKIASHKDFNLEKHIQAIKDKCTTDIEYLDKFNFTNFEWCHKYLKMESDLTFYNHLTHTYVTRKDTVISSCVIEIITLMTIVSKLRMYQKYFIPSDEKLKNNYNICFYYLIDEILSETEKIKIRLDDHVNFFYKSKNNFA